jgi:glycosyltransferase involved in cell wall biosynthesis
MRVGWLQDDPGYVGGAELTAQELRDAAPDGIEIVDCPPGGVVDGLDTYVVHNCMFYAADEQPRNAPVVRFVHDPRGPAPIDADDASRRIFYSPLHRDRVGLDGIVLPPPINVDRYRPTRQIRKHRSGAVALGTWGHPGKGQVLLAEWAAHNGPVAVFGAGTCIPQGPGIDYRGAVRPEDVQAVLWDHRTFVHLPTEVEAFGRGVAEAWAAGCELVVNRNVGALYWLEENPGAMATAAEDFWQVVLDA